MIEINCKEYSNFMLQAISNSIDNFYEEYNRYPHLTIIQVGNNDASNVYVRNKIKKCEAAGIDAEVINLPEDIKTEELIDVINYFNDHNGVDGIIVQLPLPEHINEEAVIFAIDPAKDVDGFHPQNIGMLQTADYMMSSLYLPATAYGIKILLSDLEVKIGKKDKYFKGKNAVIVGRSNIVGQPVAQVCLKMDMTTTVCHSHTKNLEEFIKNADVVIAAAGVPGLITPDMLKPGAIVIDVGINRVDGKLCGDFDPTGHENYEGYYTPVPGGVGVLTTAAVVVKTVYCGWK